MIAPQPAILKFVTDVSDNALNQIYNQILEGNEAQMAESLERQEENNELPAKSQEKDLSNTREQSSTKVVSSSNNYGKARNIAKIFKKRPGTTDLGKEYEHFYLVHLCLQLIDDVDVENFFLSSNDASYGDFDDIIVEILYKNKIETFAIQMKHKSTKRTARENFLTLTHLNTSDNFKVEKYFRSYCQDLKRLSTPVKMILFTNIKLEVPDTVQLKIQKDNIEVNVLKQDQNEFITTSVERGSCHMFSPKHEVSTDFKEFFQHFCFYTDQLNANQIKIQTSKIFLDMFKCDEFCFNNFVTFINNWSMIEGKKNKLEKILLQRVIALCVLTPFIKPLRISDKEQFSQNAVILREAISKFHVTRFNEDNYDNIKTLWSNVLNELENLDEVNREKKTYQLSVDWIQSKEELEGENVEISKLLWVLGKCPLVVKGCPQVYQIIKMCHQEKFIVLDSEENFNEGVSQLNDNISVFNSLENLKNDVQIYEDVLNNFTYSIEGQKEEILKNLLEINEDSVHKITTDKLLCNPLLIGWQKEVLPPSHIERTLSKILIDIKFLSNFCPDSVVIVSCMKNLEVKTILKDKHIIEITDDDRIDWDRLKNKKNDKVIYISNNEISEKLFKAMCSQNSTKTVHHLRYFKDSSLEWISTNTKEPSPDTPKGHDCFQELAKFRLETDKNKDSIGESDFFNDVSNINIICANPGMGKTTLMKSLKNSSSRLWTILIYSGSHSSFFQKKNISAGDFLKYICDKKTEEYNEDLDVFEALWKKKKIRVIWDGLDETSDKTFETILKIVSDVSKQGIKQFLTARINLRNRLEEKFYIFSRNLNKFNEDEQKRYVMDRLEISDNDDLNKIFKTIDNNIRSFSNNSILEIPLQIYMLTELLLRDHDNYLNLLNSTFTILDLYEHFVEEKFKIFHEEKSKLDLSIEFNVKKYTEEKNSKIKIYKTVAYNLHFPNPFMNILEKILGFNSVVKNILDDIKQYGDSVGFIINVNRLDNHNVEFVHNSFAEYFAALYLFDTEKSKARDRRFISNSRYNNIRFFLDLMLCTKSKAFVAVLYQNPQLLRECTEDDLWNKDDIGRDILELSCAWSKKYPLLEINEFKFNEINRLKTNEANDLQYKLVSKKLNEIENTISLSLKKIFLCLPFLILFHNGKERERLFNFNILYYTIKYDLEIIFDCFQDSDSLTNVYYCIDNADYLSIVLACNSKRILEKIMTETKYQNVLSKSLTILLHRSDDFDCISSLFQLLNINSLLKFMPVHSACQNGWVEIIKNVINLNVKLDVPDSNGLLPIHYVCQNIEKDARKIVELVQLVINSTTKLDVPDSNGLMPIHYACQNTERNAFKIFKLLINSTTKLDVPDSNGLMPIHYACQNEGWDAFQILKLLINLKTKLNVPDSNGLMPIHYACQNRGMGARDMVKLLINLGTNLNVPDSNGLMPIHYACRSNWVFGFKIVQLLVNSGANLNFPDSNGLMPIHYACQFKDLGVLDIVQLLINSKTNLNVPDSNGLIPIHYACQNEGKYGLEIVQLLINSKTKVDVPDSNGLMPIHYACQNKGKCAAAIVQLLINSKTQVDLPDLNGLTPIHYACQNQEDDALKIVQLLINSKVQVNLPDSNGLMPIHYACKNKGKYVLDIVQLLINSKTQINIPDSSGSMPIHYACQNLNDDVFKIVKLLTNSKTKLDVPNSNGLMPIHYACRNSGWKAQEVVQLLINSKTKVDIPDSNGLMPIHYACQNTGWNAPETVQLLINSTTKLDVPDSNGLMPIYYACQNTMWNAPKIVQLLINSKVQVNVPDSNGLMPIHYACQIKEGFAFKIVLLLINSKTEVNVPDSNGLMPIHYACQRGWFEIIKKLLDMKIKLDVTDSNGLMPIHYACQNVRDDALKIVKLLINSKIILDVPDANGLMPLHYACQNTGWHAHEIVQLLIKSNTQVDVPDSNGLMPIHYACQNTAWNAPEIVQLLIKSNTQIDVPDSNGLMPIHYACQNTGWEAPKILQLLINSKTKLNVQDCNGLLPIDYARRNKSEGLKMVEILKHQI